MHLTRTATTVVATMALALPAVAIGQDAPPQGPGQRQGQGQGQGQSREGGREGGRGQRGQGGGAPMNIEGAMKGMNRTLKGLTEIVADASKKADALRMVAELQRNCATCKALPLPAQFTKDAADDAAKAKVQEEYASDMRKTMRMLLDLEDAIVAGKSDEAKAVIAKINAMREHAHKELGVDE
jgi:hypothetical protein